MTREKPYIIFGKHQFIAEEDDEIEFQTGDPILVLERDEAFNDGWWKGRTLNGKEGLFPVNFTTENNIFNVNLNGLFGVYNEDDEEKLSKSENSSSNYFINKSKYHKDNKNNISRQTSFKSATSSYSNGTNSLKQYTNDDDNNKINSQSTDDYENNSKNIRNTNNSTRENKDYNDITDDMNRMSLNDYEFQPQQQQRHTSQTSTIGSVSSLRAFSSPKTFPRSYGDVERTHSADMNSAISLPRSNSSNTFEKYSSSSIYHDSKQFTHSKQKLSFDGSFHKKNKNTRMPQYWDNNEVCEWLSVIHFERLVNSFKRHNVNGSTLVNMNLSKLREYGVYSLSERIDLLHEILSLKEEYSESKRSFNLMHTGESPVSSDDGFESFIEREQKRMSYSRQRISQSQEEDDYERRRESRDGLRSMKFSNSLPTDDYFIQHNKVKNVDDSISNINYTTTTTTTNNNNNKNKNINSNTNTNTTSNDNNKDNSNTNYMYNTNTQTNNNKISSNSSLSRNTITPENDLVSGVNNSNNFNNQNIPINALRNNNFSILSSPNFMKSNRYQEPSQAIINNNNNNNNKNNNNYLQNKNINSHNQSLNREHTYSFLENDSTSPKSPTSPTSSMVYGVTDHQYSPYEDLTSKSPILIQDTMYKRFPSLSFSENNNKYQQQQNSKHFKNADRQGWLNVRLNNNKFWAKRWVVLIDNKLYILQSPEIEQNFINGSSGDIDEKGMNKMNEMDIMMRTPQILFIIELSNQNKILPDSEDVEQKNNFLLVDPKIGHLHLSDESQISMVTWINVLVRASTNTKRKPLPLIPLKNINRQTHELQEMTKVNLHMSTLERLKMNGGFNNTINNIIDEESINIINTKENKYNMNGMHGVGLHSKADSFIGLNMNDHTSPPPPPPLLNKTSSNSVSKNNTNSKMCMSPNIPKSPNISVKGISDIHNNALISDINSYHSVNSISSLNEIYKDAITTANNGNLNDKKYEISGGKSRSNSLMSNPIIAANMPISPTQTVAAAANGWYRAPAKSATDYSNYRTCKHLSEEAILHLQKTNKFGIKIPPSLDMKKNKTFKNDDFVKEAPNLNNFNKLKINLTGEMLLNNQKNSAIELMERRGLGSFVSGNGSKVKKKKK